MSGITELFPNIWRWDGIEQEHKFPITGYILSHMGGLFLVDPPHDPAAKEQLLQLGTPFAIVITSRWHVRGTPHWVKEFHIPIAGPVSAREQLREEGLQLDVALVDGYEQAGWQTVHLNVGEYDEVALWHKESGTVALGDLLVSGEDGNIVPGPVVYMGVSPDAVRPVLERVAALEPKLILSAHLGPQPDAARLFADVIAAL